MDVLIVVVSIAVLLAAFCGFFWSVDALNEDAIRKNEFKPVNLVYALFFAPAWIFLICTLAAEQADSRIVAAVLAAGVVLSVRWYIARCSSNKVALAPIGFLTVYSALAILVIAAVCGTLFYQRKDQEQI